MVFNVPGVMCPKCESIKCVQSWGDGDNVQCESCGYEGDDFPNAGDY